MLKTRYLKYGTILSALMALLMTALPLSAQDVTPALSVGDQLSLDGNIVIDSITSDGPGFVVIHSDSGAGAPGAVIGYQPVYDGQTGPVTVPIDVQAATPTLYAMLHLDDTTEGKYEFGSVAGADAPAMVGDAPVMLPFNVTVLSAADQLVPNNQLSIGSVTTHQPGWVVVHATQDGQPGEVIGYTAVNAGTSTGVTVNLTGEATGVVWLMLHADTGVEGEYEFEATEGAEDGPISVNGAVALAPVWTVPNIRAHNQPLGANNRLAFVSVLLDQPGWLVLHADQDGQPGEMLGYSRLLSAGLTRNATVEVDPSVVNTIVWAMLHYDTGASGTFEFGTVEGADGPVLVDGGPVLVSFLVGAPTTQSPVAGGETDTTAQETVIDVSLIEWAIEMPASVPAGTVTFNVTNNGAMDHNFEIEGNGIEQEFDTNLAPGETRSMTLDLAPGTYEVYCPIGDHAEQGMWLELTVEG